MPDEVTAYPYDSFKFQSGPENTGNTAGPKTLGEIKALVQSTHQRAKEVESQLFDLASKNVVDLDSLQDKLQELRIFQAESRGQTDVLVWLLGHWEGMYAAYGWPREHGPLTPENPGLNHIGRKPDAKP